MVRKLECDCDERIGIKINSIKQFQELKNFFDEQVKNGTFVEEVPIKPYYVWKEKGQEKKWFATKWYRCIKCNCLWEFNYPDFPAKGFVNKFPRGIF